MAGPQGLEPAEEIVRPARPRAPGRIWLGVPRSADGRFQTAGFQIIRSQIAGFEAIAAGRARPGRARPSRMRLGLAWGSRTRLS